MACASCAAAAAESSYPFSLGTYSLQAAGSNAAVAQDRQLWLDRAMAWTFGFHRDEGIACFERVLELDPGCALAHWGIAFCHGPHYNMNGDRYVGLSRQPSGFPSMPTAFAHAQPYMGHDTPLIRIEWWKAPLTERLGRLAT